MASHTEIEANGTQAQRALTEIVALAGRPTKVIASSELKALPQTSQTRLASTNAQTILYLAYGSNLSRETFIGNRGIKPLSAHPVHVPYLDLTFDLAGIPYTEPCFANSTLRTPHPQPGEWNKGMVGVVYEVTPEDYRTIIATEGGGSSYQDVEVVCLPIAPGLRVVPFPDPRGGSLKAHTLLSPPGIGGRMPRPNPKYAQPSARYLKLLTDGGEEHVLPADYLAYLYSLQPYTITTSRQKIGKVTFSGFWMPIILAMFALGKLLADEDGKIPGWLAKVYAVIFNLLWVSYDAVFKVVFGDGERTMDDDDEESGRCSRPVEKAHLIMDEKASMP